MTRRWLITNSITGTAPQETRAAAGPPRLSPLVQRVLAARGLTDPDRIAQFREPKLMHLHDPALMPNVDRAAKRICDAIRNGESIVIFGDYDVDGITATAILFHTIRTIDPNATVRSYVPHRLDEGYGINCDALRQLRKEGAQLVISVDCGITAKESALTADEIGLDLIITDHHNLPEREEDLPAAYALVHPRLPGSAYPFGELCGAGVAFKLAWQLARVWCNSERVSESLQKVMLDMLPLVALGTIADVVPLVGENRVLSSFGLRLIKQTPLVGLRALIEASGLMDEKIDCEKVGFVLGPRLNACGRLGHASAAMRLFCDAPVDEAIQIANDLTRVNRERQEMQRRIFDRAASLAEDRGMTRDDQRAIVLADAEWHPGVVGIVCSRLVEQFGRPAILMNRGEEICKGSGRSIDGYSIHAGLASCAEMLTTWGGHDMAAGLSLAPSKLDAFTEQMIAHANEHIEPENLVPALTVDCCAELSEISLAAAEEIRTLSPFGRANRRPLICVQDVVVQEARQVGANARHLSLRVMQQNCDRRAALRAIWFGGGEFAGDLANGQRLDLVIEPKINEWNGRRSAEAEIRDVRLRSRGEATLPEARAGTDAMAGRL